MLINEDILNKLQTGDTKVLAKCITCVENEEIGYDILLKSLTTKNLHNILGVTGPPGAGKSTLINALLKELTQQNKKVAVLSVDPSSPFNYGALLGDRVRMSDFYLNPLVYIRSLASRCALGGLHPKIIEITEVVKNAGFDYIIIETVGVGQSEVEIAGIADTTIVVKVPEAGDEVQTMKAGVMEIADIFVVNKCDRPNADEFAKNLFILAHSKQTDWEALVIKCIASQDIGIKELVDAIQKHSGHFNNEKKTILLTEKILQLLSNKYLKNINKQKLLKTVRENCNKEGFNIFKIADDVGNTY